MKFHIYNFKKKGSQSVQAASWHGVGRVSINNEQGWGRDPYFSPGRGLGYKAHSRDGIWSIKKEAQFTWRGPMLVFFPQIHHLSLRCSLLQGPLPTLVHQTDSTWPDGLSLFSEGTRASSNSSDVYDCSFACPKSSPHFEEHLKADVFSKSGESLGGNITHLHTSLNSTFCSGPDKIPSCTILCFNTISNFLLIPCIITQY